MTEEDISIIYENNIFYCTKNNTKWISVDGEKWYGEEKRIKELENKIADIKANCDLAIEGRDIKIKELEQELTVEKDLHQEETNLHLHAENYIKSLEKDIGYLQKCKQKIIELKKQVKDLEKENAELKADNDARKYAMVMSEKVEKQLREENAKLESEFRICEKNADTYYDQLSKAKDLIEDMYDQIPASHSDYYKDVMERARQFLKEIEK